MEMTMRVNKDDIIAYFFQLKKDNPNITIDEVKALVLEKFQSENEGESEAIENQPPVMTTRCSKCGTNNPEIAAFCWSCGAKMTKAPEKPDSVVKHPVPPAKDANIGEYRDGVLVCRCCGQPLSTNSDGTNGGASDTAQPPRRRSYSGVICSYCEKRIEYRHKVVVCPECGDPHHIDCWRANQYHCSIPNCSGYLPLEETAPPPPQPDSAEERPPRSKSSFSLKGLFDIWDSDDPDELDDFEWTDRENERRKSRKRKKWFVIFIIIALIAACAGLGWLALQKNSPNLGLTPLEFRAKYNKEEANLVRALNGVSVLKISKINLQDRGNYKVFVFANERHSLIGVVNADGKLRAVLAGGRYVTSNDQFMLARLWHTTLGVFSTQSIVNADGLLNLEEISRRTLLSPTVLEIETNEPYATLKPAELKDAKCGWVTTEANEKCYVVICNMQDNIEELASGILGAQAGVASVSNSGPGMNRIRHL